jgi:DNA repair exonuclease SbcCD ATPase subunit
LVIASISSIGAFLFTLNHKKMELLSDEQHPTKDEFKELDNYVDELEKRVSDLESILSELLDLLSTDGVMDTNVQSIILKIHSNL